MRKRKAVWTAVVLGILLLGNFSWASPERQSPQQQITFSQDVEKIFQKAVAHYREGKYAIVEWELRSLLEIHPRNHRITAIYYLIGRAQYKQKKYADARKTLRQLIREYPSSAYVDDAEYLLAAIDFEEERYEDCARRLLDVLQKTNDPRLRDKVRNLLFPLLTDYLESPQLHMLESQYGPPAQTELKLAMAVQLYRTGQQKQAQQALQAWLKNNAAHPLRSVAQNYLKLASQVSPQKVRIGVILPLTGYFKKEARALLSGIQFALKNDPAAKQFRVQLVVKDSQGDMLQTIRSTKELIFDDHVAAIIGELESDKSAVVGALAAPENVAVLAPAAKEVGLAALGSNIFQMVPDITVRGQKIAEYAINEMNLQSFAVLAPADKYGKNMADSFARTVDRLNGTIVAETWYYEQATDVRDQFSYIRRLGLKKMIRDSIIAENPALSASEVDSLVKVVEDQRRRALVENESNRPMKLSDSTAVPVTSIDAVFLPVYTEDISYVAPQLALYNIQAQLLGGEFWNDEEVLDQNARYVSGVVFPSDYYVSPTDMRFLRFRNRYRMQMGRTPDRMDVLGYDTARLLLSVIKKGAVERTDLLRALQDVTSFQGLLQPYRFDEKPRVNSFLHILRYENNTIHKVQ